MDTYEKKYKDTLERAKKLYEQGTITESLAYIFPELKESEDDRIRKALIRFHKSTIDIDGIKGDEIVAWLEKQGEQKPAKQPHSYELEEEIEEWLGCEAFPEGTNITPLPKAMKIVRETANHFYDFGRKQQEYRLQKPADKVEPRQEELTEFEKAVKQVMEEAIECGDTHNLKADADMLLRLVQKPAWSEEDEKEYKYVLKFVDNILNNCGNKKDYDHCKRCYDWLKSLKQKIGE